MKSYNEFLELCRKDYKPEGFAKRELGPNDIQLLAVNLVHQKTGKTLDWIYENIKFRSFKVNDDKLEKNDELEALKQRALNLEVEGFPMFIPVCSYKNGKLERTTLLMVSRTEAGFNITLYNNHKQHDRAEDKHAEQVVKMLQEQLRSEGHKSSFTKNEEINKKIKDSSGIFIATEIANCFVQHDNSLVIEGELQGGVQTITETTGSATEKLDALTLYCNSVKGGLQSLLSGTEVIFKLSMSATHHFFSRYKELRKMLSIEISDSNARYEEQYNTNVRLSNSTIQFFMVHLLANEVKRREIASDSKDALLNLEEAFNQIKFFRIDAEQTFKRTELAKLASQISDLRNYTKSERSVEQSLLTSSITISTDEYKKLFEIAHSLLKDKAIPSFKAKETDLNKAKETDLNKAKDTDSNKASVLLEKLKQAKEARDAITKRNPKLPITIHELDLVCAALNTVAAHNMNFLTDDYKFLKNKIEKLYKNYAGVSRSTFSVFDTARSAKITLLIEEMMQTKGNPDAAEKPFQGPILMPYIGQNHYVLISIVKNNKNQLEVQYFNSIDTGKTGKMHAEAILKDLQSFGKKKNISVAPKVVNNSPKVSIQHGNICGIAAVLFAIDLQLRISTGKGLHLLKVIEGLKTREEKEEIYNEIGKALWKLLPPKRGADPKDIEEFNKDLLTLLQKFVPKKQASDTPDTSKTIAAIPTPIHLGADPSNIGIERPRAAADPADVQTTVPATVEPAQEVKDDTEKPANITAPTVFPQKEHKEANSFFKNAFIVVSVTFLALAAVAVCALCVAINPEFQIPKNLETHPMFNSIFPDRGRS